MRYREAFSLYRRTVRTGGLVKVVFYYQTYDEKGRRLCGHSTGQTSKTAAREYCNKLLREGKLLEVRRARVPTFAEFAAGWWDFQTCQYLKSRKGRRPITQNYADSARRVTEKHLLPQFGHRYLDEITDTEIDDWMLSMQDRNIGRRVRNEQGELVEKKYDNSTINWVFGILKVMLGEAVRRRVIKFNPCATIDELMESEKEIEILTPDDVRAFFSTEWFSDQEEKICFLANKLSACSGMRISEVLGLRGEYLFDTYISVCAQFNNQGYGDTKTHKDRDIPIPALMKRELDKLKKLNGEGFLFSTDGGEGPVSRHRVREVTYQVLGFIGIDEKERLRRGLTFHGWRHFFNTTLIMANVSDRKVQSVTGHSSARMTKHYQHLRNNELAEVKEVQKKLFVAPKKAAAQKKTAR
jgi:integrase